MPKVFISYTHDSDEQTERVGRLSDKLRRWGVACEIDQYEMSPAGGWAQWCEQQIDAADFVLIVCTEAYRRRFMGEESKNKGLGGRWEGWIIRQELYDSAVQSAKFVPILVNEADAALIPLPLHGRTHFTPFDSEESFTELYRLITKQPRKEKPDLGQLVALPNKDRWQTPPPGRPSSRPRLADAARLGVTAVVGAAVLWLCVRYGCFGGRRPSVPGSVRATMVAFPVMPWALRPMIASNPSLYWLQLNAENQTARPAHLDARCEVLNEPPVATCATRPWSVSLSPGQSKQEKIDPQLAFLGTPDPDQEIDLQITWRVTDDKDSEVEGGRQTVTTKIPARNSFYWDLKDAAGREIPKEFLVASLAAWSKTAQKNHIYQEGKRLRASRASMTEFLARIYAEILTNPARLAIARGVPPLPPVNAAITLRTPAEVLEQRQANPIEAALLVGALSQEPTEWYGARLAGASVRQTPDSNAQILVLWTDLAGAWQAIDLTRTGSPFEENRRSTEQILGAWFRGEVLKALDRHGVYLDLKLRRTFLEFSKAASEYKIQPFPQADR